MELTVESFAGRPVRTGGGLRRPVPRRPVDLVRLARATLGNRSIECEVLEFFRSQSALQLARLKDAVRDAAWRDAARTIEASARGIGAGRLAGTAARAATLADDAPAARRSEMIAALEHEIDETNAFIEKLLADD